MNVGNVKYPWAKESEVDIGCKAALFILSPFFSLLYSLKTLNRRSSYVVIFLFCVFLGLSFTISNDRSIESADGASYRSRFEEVRKATSLTFSEGAKDYFFDIISFYVSRVTSNYHFMFMIFAVIFAFFQLKSFRYLTSLNNYKYSLLTIILSFFFLCSNSIVNINGVRFWTAAWIAVYSIFQVYISGNKRYYLLGFITPFVHLSFVVFVALLLIASLFRRFERMSILIYALSFVFSTFAIQIFQNHNILANIMPMSLQNMITSYTDQDAIDLRMESIGIIARIFSSLEYIYVNILVALLIINRSIIPQRSKNLYIFLLIYMSFTNFVMPIPSLGARFILLSYPLISYLWIDSINLVRYKYLLYLLPFANSLFIYKTVRLYFRVVGPLFFVSSPLGLLVKSILA